MKSTTTCLVGVLLLIAGAARAQGPSQPEAMRFEAVDITDMVNLATGDFVYSLPLLSVPGPEGSYPLSMSYKAGIGPNKEATWVGLGWTLNPGAINRTVTGYADEFKGGDVVSHFRAKGEREYAISVGIAVGTPFSSVGLNATYNVNSGKMGVNAVAVLGFGTPLAGVIGAPVLSLSAGSSGFGANASGSVLGARVGASVSVGTDGAMNVSGNWQYSNLRASVGTQGSSVGIAAGSGSSAVGFNISSNGVGASYAGASFGAFSQSRAGAGTVDVQSFGLPTIELGIFRIDLGFSSSQWKLDEKHFENSYGHAQQVAYSQSGATNRKFERVLIGENRYEKRLHPAQDSYIVGAQGLSGSFAPFVRASFELKDGKEQEEQGQLILNGSDADHEAIYRFLGDTGGNLVSNETGWGDNLEGIRSDGASSSYHTGSKQIEPHYEHGTDPNRLTGFTITDAQGKRYEFKQPVYSNYEYTWTKDYDPPNIKYVNNTMQVNTPYATQWLLTAIKGPDYVQRGAEALDSDDWGYWVRFSYTLPEEHVWRAPFQGPITSCPYSTWEPCQEYDINPDNDQIKSYSWGKRETVYLASVETATHIALFETEASGNRTKPRREEAWAKGVDSYPTRIDDKTFEMEGDLSQLIDNAEPEDPIFRGINFGSLCDTVFLREDKGVEWDYYIDVSGGNTTTVFDLDYPGGCSTYTYGSYLGPEPSSSDIIAYQEGRRLAGVTLYTKKQDGSKDQGVKSVAFTYDWSLRHSYPSSVAPNQGSLTLKSVHTYGVDGLPTAPPYLFEYGNGDDAGVGLNPDWGRYSFDDWGSYRDPDGGADQGLGMTNTPQNQSRADLAAAWSLTGITTPTGAVISIEYESDDYFYAGQAWPAHEATTWDLEPASGETNQRVRTNHVVFDGDLDVSDTLFVEGVYTYNGTNDTDGSIITGSSRNPYVWVSIVDKFPDGSVELDREITFCPSREVPGCTPYPDSTSSYSYLYYEYYASVAPERVYGGGIRVKSISTRFGGGDLRTSYSYSLPGGRSSGVATALNNPTEYYEFPGVLSDPLTPERRAVDRMYAGRLERYGKSAPSVVYSSVRVENASNGQPVGYTVYEFSSREGMVGFPVATSYYENAEGGYRLTKREETEYAFSSELADIARVVRPSSTEPTEPELLPEAMQLGVIQEKHEYSIEDDQGTRSDTYTRTYDNVFAVGTRSEEYAYADNGEVDIVVAESRTTGFDALSGSVVETAQPHADGGVSYARTVPASWLYPEMRAKNMLSQQALQVQYLDRTQVFDLATLRDYTFPYQDVVKGSLTTWAPDLPVRSGGVTTSPSGGALVWRQNDTFVYDRDFRDGDARLEYAPPSRSLLDHLGHDYLSPTISSPWRMTSNVTIYDQHSHPVESVGRDGTYTSSEYDSKGLPVAITTNARLLEGIYLPFENGRSEDARTGVAGGYLKSQTHALAGTPGLVPAGSGQYVVELWVRPDVGETVSLDAETFGGEEWSTSSATPHVATKTGWVLLRLDGVSPGADVVASGSGSYDDLRIHPEVARMRTFAYDVVTQQVTAITDASNATAFFEYDQAGRLVRVRDEDGHLLSRHEYAYKRDESRPVESYADGAAMLKVVIVGPTSVDKGDAVELEAVPLNTSGSVSYSWSRECGSGGQISMGSSRVVTFTTPTDATSCEIRCVMTDDDGAHETNHHIALRSTGVPPLDP